jgi:hypothetical protein
MLDLDIRTRIQRRGRSVLPADDERGSTVFALDFNDFTVTLGFALMVALHHQAIPWNCSKRTRALFGHGCLLPGVGSTVAQGGQVSELAPFKRFCSEMLDLHLEPFFSDIAHAVSRCWALQS